MADSSLSQFAGIRRELLDVLSEVKTRVQDKLGVLDFPLPQFILIGKQSVGKSRLIEALAGEQFTFVSGTLGSRRPTVLEFRNVSGSAESCWSVLDKKVNRWTSYSVRDVMQIIGSAHESLGATVSSEAVYVRIESPHCVDMQIVDLPGFRDFAMDNSKQALADQIDQMVSRFMQDDRNVMLCVEEAGDAANLSTLARCKRLDPNFNRTILIRNKLDKYYKDLDGGNVNEWLAGFGDLPDSLPKFALTLPHWKDGENCPKAFVELREDMTVSDVSELRARGANEKFSNYIGFGNFTKFMGSRIESLFASAIGPVLKKLREMRDSTSTRFTEIGEELENTNPATIVSTIRDVGMSFSHSLNHVMEGFVRSDAGRCTLEDELRNFHSYHKALGTAGNFLMLPSEDFKGLDEYISYLRDDIKVPAFDVEVNGGAQFRRLMFEVEVFLRFSEIGVETRKKDVIQARGVSMGSVTWRDVVVKLLSNEAHLPMKKRVQYVAERIKFFFISQKEVIVNFMLKIKGSSDEQMFSTLYTKHVKLLLDNSVVKARVYQTFDQAVDRQLHQFMELFNNTLASTFSNPWVFLKRASLHTLARASVTNQSSQPATQQTAQPTPQSSKQSAPAAADAPSGKEVQQPSPVLINPAISAAILDETSLPSFEDTKSRIPLEISSRSGWETVLSQWLSGIPQEPNQIDEAVDKVQMLVIKTFAFIRAQIADQIELFAESFFKLPMMRRLEEDMSVIAISDNDREGYEGRKVVLEGAFKKMESDLAEVEDCIQKLQTFALKSQRPRRGDEETRKLTDRGWGTEKPKSAAGMYKI